MSGNRFARPKRTDADRLTDAVLFLHRATPTMILAHTPESLCALYGITQRDRRRKVECDLLAKQAVLRRQA